MKRQSGCQTRLTFHFSFKQKKTQTILSGNGCSLEVGQEKGKYYDLGIFS